MTDDIIRDIRKRCRMAMNGVASASMRAYGLDYKLNFGVSVGKIKEIAARYQPDKDLAEVLWKDGTRELKILATMLYPLGEFDEATAKRWIREIPNQELREQLGFNIFRFLPYTYPLSVECGTDEDQSVRASVYWFLGRYIMTKEYSLDLNLADFPRVWDDIVSEDVSLRNAANLFLKNAGRISQHLADAILEEISAFGSSEDLLKNEIYSALTFEFDFFYNRLQP